MEGIGMTTSKKIVIARNGKGLLIVMIVLMLLFCVSEAALSKPLDVLTVACVNFRTDWGNKEANLNRIKGYIEAAAKRGADIILFPETALTGYDIDEEVKMHKENAETIPGPSTNEIAQLTRKYGVYVIVGMAEKDKDNPEIIYNSVAIVGPEGVIDSYAKIHPAFGENKWCKKGKRPVLFETPWGPVGVGICYDTTMFPELPRYYAACGARLYLHATAISFSTETQEYYLNQLKARSIENIMFVASANLVGKEVNNTFFGTSIIVGPGQASHVNRIYAGPASEDTEELIIATIDLGEVDRMRESYPLFRENPDSGSPDWRLKMYKKFLEKIEETTDLGNYE